MKRKAVSLSPGDVLLLCSGEDDPEPWVEIVLAVDLGADSVLTLEFAAQRPPARWARGLSTLERMLADPLRGSAGYRKL